MKKDMIREDLGSNGEKSTLFIGWKLKKYE